MYPVYTLPENYRERLTPTATITVILKPDKDATEIENYKPISMMNTNAKIFNKISANRIQQHISKIRHHGQVGFIPGMQGFFNITNLSMWYTILTNWNIKNHMIISMEKGKPLTKFNIHLWYKNPPGSRERRNIFQYNKNHIQQIHSKHFPQWWTTESFSSKDSNKARVSTRITTMHHSFGSPSHSQLRRKNKGIKGFRLEEKK